MKKYYVQNGSVFLCRLNKKFQDNTNSDTCEFRTINPKGIAEHISYHHREDSLIFRKFIKNQFEGIPAVGGLKFSMAQKNLQKVPVGGIAS